MRAHVPTEHRSGEPFHGRQGDEIVFQPSGRRVTFSEGQDVRAEKGNVGDLRVCGLVRDRVRRQPLSEGLMGASDVSQGDTWRLL